MIRLLPCSLVFPWIARAVGHGRFRAGRVYPDETLRNEPLRACADGGLYSLRVPSARSRALEQRLFRQRARDP